MAWARRNPPNDPNAPPDPSDIDDPSRSPTEAERSAMDMVNIAEALDRSPAMQSLGKALPYIIPAAFAMSVVSWGAFIYFTYKRSKHYYG